MALATVCGCSGASDETPDPEQVTVEERAEKVDVAAPLPPKEALQRRVEPGAAPAVAAPRNAVEEPGATEVGLDPAIAGDLVEKEEPPVDVGIDASVPTRGPSLSDPRWAKYARKLHVTSREAQARQALLEARGGSEATEAAVARALRWLARQQHDDGHWEFTGDVPPAELAATGLALLPFLAAGHTPPKETSPYAEHVSKGLDYLMKHGRLANHRLRFDENGNGMYGQAFCTLALCEAYAMTGDKRFLRPAEQATEYVAHTQESYGGWRNAIGEPQDVSVSAWQFHALLTARSNHISPPREENIALAGAFLHFRHALADVTDAPPQLGSRRTSTAIRLLCRLMRGAYTSIDEAAAELAQQEPRPEEFYHNFFATWLLCELQGEGWEAWKAALQPALLKTQDDAGEDAGCFDFRAPDVGPFSGPLYSTAFCTLTLQVYYRYAPVLPAHERVPVEF